MESKASIKSKTVIITGGAQGIGRGTALLFASQGAQVVVGKELLQEWEKLKSSSSGSLSFCKFDASKDEDCKNLVEFALKEHGSIEVLFNNVGVQPKDSNVPIHLLDEDVWDHVFNINIKSFYRMCKYVIPDMLSHPEKSHSIINNSSIQGIHSQVRLHLCYVTQAQKGVPAYAATKGAILSLTRQLAVEYGSANIRVNAVSPGSIATPLAMANNKSFDYITSNTPLGTIGEPLDVAELVLFLASDAAKWITGQNFVVDGGITIKGGWAPLSDNLF